jgi:hypothetical protein
MKEEIKIKVPTSWKAVTLKQYLNLQKDLLAYGDDEIAYIAALLYHLCGVKPKWIPQLSTDTLNAIRADLMGFMGDSNYELQRIITIDGKEYGFEPNLSKMAYGAYLDITKYEAITIDKNWNKIMAILYRPITKKTISLYNIETYDSEKANPQIFDNVGMDVHFGAMFFFLRTLADLVNDILNFSKEVELPPNIKQTLEKNGEAIKQLYNYQETISPSSLLSLARH